MKLINSLLSQSISRKIWVGISILIVAYSLTIALSFISKGMIRRDIETISRANENITALGQSLLANLNKQMEMYKHSVVAGELSILDDAEKYEKSCIEVLTALEEMFLISQFTLREVQSLKEDIVAYGKDAKEIYPILIRASEVEDTPGLEKTYEKSLKLAQRKEELFRESTRLTMIMMKDLSRTGNAMMEKAESQKWVEIAIFLTVLFVSLIVTRLVMSRFITKPIATMTHALEAMEDGDFNLEIHTDFGDEIGRMADSMREMIEAQRQKIEFAKSIAEGDLSVRPHVKSEHDILGKSLQTMIDNLNAKADVAEAIAEGDLDHKIYIASDRDKVGKALKSMTDNMRAVVRQASVIADGDLTSDIVPRSERDELGNALWKMTLSLRDMSKADKKQSWIKTGQNELSEKMRGDLDIAPLSQNVIAFLAKYLGALIGSLYIFDEESENLKLTGRYAVDDDRGLKETIKIGQGLVGQAAFQREMISVSDIPENYIRINSAHGHALPGNIVVVPIEHEIRLIGVMELGSFEELSQEKLEFLDLVVENIAVSLDSARSRERMKELLEETQRQSGELHRQQNVLRESNEELESQTRLLRENEEQLRTRKEELQAANRELEKRTRDLEAQKDYIKEKNIALETARNDLEEKANELEIISKYKSEFMANMSHELRTPLNSLLILSRDLADNNDVNLTEDQLKSAQIIHSSGNQLLSLINDILDLSKVEAGKMPIHIESVRLTNIAESIGAQFEPIVNEKGLEFNVHLGDDLRPLIRTDLQRMEQVIRNLVSNAVKFTDEGSITIDFHRPDPCVNLTLSGLDHREALGISVIDTGTGIPKNKQEEIFEAFRQVDGSISREFGGTGLGLSISREFAGLLGGEIQVESEPGKGSKFTFFIPFEARENSAEQGPEVSKGILKPVHALRAINMKPDIESIPDDREKLERGDRVVLVIEDDSAFAEILLNQCHDIGFKCLVASNGEDGLDMAEKYLPDALVLDVQLPGIDGYTVLHKLKEDPGTRHIPVHVISANPGNTDACGIGAVGCFVKPVTKEDLKIMFRKIEEFSKEKIRRLLLVEDDPNMITSIRKLIGNGDVEIEDADTGTKAIEALKTGKFDCMVLDLGLPDITGIELLRRLEQERDTAIPPVIFYTGKELDKKEKDELRRYSQSIIVKGTTNAEDRLLDDTALFLHRLIENMPKAKQEVISRLNDSDFIFSDKKVLLVDDDMRNVFALARKLQEKGIKIFKAENGQKALMLLDQDPEIDLVLMDVMMPVMDGLEATRRIRTQSRFSGLPIIALTARAMEGDRDRCMDAGASDYLPKPVDMHCLFSMMRDRLNESA